MFAAHWDEAKNNCKVTEAEVVRAEALGAEILTAVGEAKLKEISEAKRLRNLTAEYLRRGIDDIKENASYVFSKEEKRFKRYPNLFVGGRKKKASGKSHPNGNGTAQNGQAASPTAPVIVPAGLSAN